MVVSKIMLTFAPRLITTNNKVMKKVYYIIWNRLTAIFAVWALLLAWCAICSTNVYINGFVLYFGFMAVILACGYVMESKSQTKGEKWLLSIF